MVTMLQKAIERAQTLLNSTANAAMATVNADGSPHNTPFLFIHNDTLEYVYWASHPESLHCQNALRTGQIFVVLYDGNKGGGLYINTAEVKELSGNELKTAVQALNKLRAKANKNPMQTSDYSAPNPQRMYRAVSTNFYVNVSERNDEGTFIRDVRRQVSRGDLLLHY